MHRVVSREQWIAERPELLAEEKEFTRRRDALSEKRRAPPWVRIDKHYEFDSAQGRVTLANLFRDKSQLFVQHVTQGLNPPLQRVRYALGIDGLEENVAVLLHRIAIRVPRQAPSPARAVHPSPPPLRQTSSRIGQIVLGQDFLRLSSMTGIRHADVRQTQQRQAVR